MAKKKLENLIPIYQLKIVLSDIEPPVMRIIQIKGNSNLGKLHDYIQGVMSWTNTHMHEFIIDGKSYQDTEQMNEDFKEPGVFDERKYRINKLLKEGDTFKYIYDYGDYWVHEIAVEKVISPEERVYYPICIYGQRACPPEDSGGSCGYEELLEVLKDPTHEDYEHCSEWAGEDFDPNKFDQKEANHILDVIKSNIREPRKHT